MATLLPTLNDHDYRNWVKAGLGLKFARDGIVVFVETNIVKFHEDVMKCLPAGQHCDNCTTENTIPCKSSSLFKNNKNFCKLSKNACTVHDPNNPSKKSKNCPYKVCNVIRDAIVEQHRFTHTGPSWRNTDSSRWCREKWQLATCYMPEGYQDSSSSSETDFPGLLSIVINNTVFDTVVTDNLGNKNNVFCKARETRNEILHNANMRMSDADLARHIKVLDDMLSDTKCPAGKPRAVEARALLTQIQNDTLSVSTEDADGIRADALKAIAEIAERKEEALESIDAKEVASKSSLRKMVNTSKGVFQLERKEAVTEIQKERKDAVSAVHQAKEESKRNDIPPLAALLGNWMPMLAEVVAPVIKSVSEYERRDTKDFDNVDPLYFNAYIEALKDGKEKTNSIRINVVGNAEVGKSTLTKNLLGMIPDRNMNRTDGIEVHCNKFYDSSDWSSKDVPSDEKTAQRIAMSSEAMQSKEQPVERFNINTSHIEHQPDPTEIKTPGIPSDDEIVQAFSQTSLSEQLPTNDECGPLLTIPTDDLKINETEKERINLFSSELRINDTEKERIHIFTSKLKESHLTNVTCIQIWDFGGQFEYYATHQLFHSQRAVYLLVLDASADLNDITETCELTNALGDKDVKYFCKFWMHSIHSFVGNDKNEPPVILVATKTDKIPGWNEEKKKDFFESVRQLFDETPVVNHIQSKCFAVNNFSEDAADFNKLREYIGEVAKSQDSWNSTVPARWIPLEDSLRRRTSEKHITLQQVMTIGSELNIPINDEPQIKAFLMYHHSLGNLVYFDDDDLSESTVIDPQWIIDAFKTIITAKTKNFCLENGPLRDKWKQLTKEAILSKELIKAVWNIDDKNDFSSNEDILLKYLIKLGIISEVTELNLEKHTEDHKDYFLVPSLLNAKSSRLCLEQLMEERTVTQTALVFAFKDNHVPLLLHHRLTAAALGKWNVLVFRDQRMLSENIGIYELDEVHAGLIEVCDRSIEISVINLCGNPINPKQTDKLRRFVSFKIDVEFQRFRLSKTKKDPYTLRIRCNFNNNKGKQTIKLKKIENSEYDNIPCPDKDQGHDIRTSDVRNQWSGVNILKDKNDKELLKSLRDYSMRDLTLSVTERELSKIACALGFNWELLGIDLGIPNAIIEQIKMDNPYKTKTQIFQMLKTWGEREAEEASMEKLLAAIVDVVDMTVDWDKIRNILDE